MKLFKIFSYSYVAVSAIAAPWMVFADLRILPTCIWGIGLMIAAAGMFLTDEKENAPDERQLNQGQRKISNFNLSKELEEVNGRTENL